MKLKLVLAVALLLVGIGAPAAVILGPGLTSRGSASASGTTVRAATVGSISTTVTGSGSLSPTTVYGLSFGCAPEVVSTAATSSGTGGSTGSTSGATLSWPVKTVWVKAGDTVKAGAALATAEDSAAQAALATAQAKLDAAKAQLATDRAGPDSDTKAAAQDQVTQAQDQLDQAIANRSNTVAQNALKLEQAEKAVADATTKLDDDTAATAPLNVLDGDATVLSQAKAQLASTKLQVQSSNTQATQQVTNAQASVTAAKHNYTLKVAPAERARLLTDEAAVSTAQSALDAAKIAAAGATLRSPADGTVSAVNIAAGAAAGTGYAIEIEVAPYTLAVTVGESDVATVAAGQPATVTVTAASSTVEGTVLRVNPVATARGGGSSVASYEVVIVLAEAPATFATGMSASVTITTASVEDALLVPLAAVTTTANGHTVNVRGADGSVAARPVEIGLAGTSQVQITSGLAEGELVVVDTTRATTSTSNSGGNGAFPGGAPFGP